MFPASVIPEALYPLVLNLFHRLRSDYIITHSQYCLGVPRSWGVFPLPSSAVGKIDLVLHAIWNVWSNHLEESSEFFLSNPKPEITLAPLQPESYASEAFDPVRNKHVLLLRKAAGRDSPFAFDIGVLANLS